MTSNDNRAAPCHSCITCFFELVKRQERPFWGENQFCADLPRDRSIAPKPSAPACKYFRSPRSSTTHCQNIGQMKSTASGSKFETNRGRYCGVRAASLRSAPPERPAVAMPPSTRPQRKSLSQINLDQNKLDRVRLEIKTNRGRYRGVRPGSPCRNHRAQRARSPRNRTHTAPPTSSPFAQTLPRRRLQNHLL